MELGGGDGMSYEEWEEKYFGGNYDAFCKEYGPEDPEEEE